MYQMICSTSGWVCDLRPHAMSSPKTKKSHRLGIARNDLRTEVEMDVFSFIDCSNRSHSLPALFELLVNCSNEEGFGQVACGALNYFEPVRLPGHPMPAVAINFPSQ